ncbi:MAG: myo-inositol 2-dehydrogenase/D-chiro-inositol 1-dehydrogenase [Saprospiraceae bacterium]|jgi:myo-inositol 2-dehydrogenase/D-chiro-inositol 1-dehydrogenase
MIDKIINQVAIIGLGRAGRFHLNSLTSMPNSEVVYVVDPYLAEDDAICQDATFTLLRDLEEVLNDKTISAVIVATPTQFHFEYVCRALDAGKHVFAEKPLGKSLQEIKHCFDLAKKKGQLLYLGFQRRYDHNFNVLKSKIASVGDVRTVKMSSRDNPKPSLDYLRISGNIFHDMLIHDFDMLIYLFGHKIPESIYAIGYAYDSDIAAMDDYDTVLVTIKYADGMVCSIDTSRTAAYGYDQRIELFAEHGMLIADNVRNDTVQVHTAQGMSMSPINYSFPQRYQEAYRVEMEDFVSGITLNRLVNVSKNECILSSMIADAATLSIKENRAIDFIEYSKKNFN